MKSVLFGVLILGIIPAQSLDVCILSVSLGRTKAVCSNKSDNIVSSKDFEEGKIEVIKVLVEQMYQVKGDGSIFVR